MNYIYDIYLNFKNVPYDFFDWNNNDTLTHIKKIPAFKIDLTTFKNIYTNKIKVDSSFLKNIRYKTEIWKSKKNMKYSCLFYTNNSILSISFNNNGISHKKSSLYIDEELEVLENCLYNIKEYKLKYSILKSEKNLLKTRKEMNEKKFINDVLNKIDIGKLKYIYFEFYGKTATKEEMIHSLKNINYLNKNFKNLYNILKLISTIKK